MTVSEIAEKLNKCTTTIYKTIQKLGLEYKDRKGKPWNQEEIQFLEDNYKTMSYDELANKLNRTKKAIQGKLHGLNLIKEIKSKNWSDEEIQFLKENINSLSYEEISSHLNRSISAIYTKVWELDLIIPELKGSRKLKSEQVNFIIANYDKYTDRQLANRFNVSIEAVSAVRKKFGIKKTGNEISGPTYIEEFIMKVLDSLNIKYLYNKPLGPYTPDFQICNTKIIIEVQGDYFHCNPYVYKNGPKDEIQIKHVLRDYYKKCYFLSSGYTILEIWEKDINENPEEVIKRIKEKLPFKDKAHRNP